MTTIQNNPFLKPNPYQVFKYQKFKHPTALKNQNSSYQPLYKEYSNRPPNHHIENIWSFNQNNLSKKFDFSRKYEPGVYKPTDFEVKMKTSQIMQIPNNNQKALQLKDSRLQNPFYRKNLLINKEEVANQIQLDIVMYRNKAKSDYQPRPSQTSTYNNYMEKEDSPIANRPSFGNNNYQMRNSKIYSSKYVEEEVPESQSLKYSKTPRSVERIPSFRQEEQKSMRIIPERITLKGKVFHLNDIVQIS